jgi:hypothetical protein
VSAASRFGFRLNRRLVRSIIVEVAATSSKVRAGTFHFDRMIMRRTTRRASPWTIDNAMFGLGIPVLITAVGRANRPEPPWHLHRKCLSIRGKSIGDHFRGISKRLRLSVAKM